MHPYQHTIDLITRQTLRAPLWFPESRRKEMTQTIEEMRQNQNIPHEKVEDTLIAFGKELWPYHRALSELHRQYAARREEILIREKLKNNVELFKKFDRYLDESGDIHAFKQGRGFEKFFDPEEWGALSALTMEAHDETMAEFQRECVSTRLEECNDLVGQYREELERVDAKVAALKRLAEKSEKWREEILAKARAFEEGWGAASRAPEERQVEEAIDFYERTIKEGVL